jgi:FkbM family methyltransferase
VITDAIKKILLSMGWEIRRAEKTPRGSLKGVLTHLNNVGIQPKTVIDVGAAFGSWSLLCAQVFPQSEYVLIEPLTEYQPALQQVVKVIQKADTLFCGISSTTGERTLYIHPDLVGSSLKEEHEPHTQNVSKPRVISCKTIDTICEEKHLQAPFLIKLDIQGSELDAIIGAQKTLTQTDVLIMEVSFLECMKGTPLIASMIQIMGEKGFVPYDLFGLNYRPLDQALAQMDIVFVPTTSPLLNSKWYAQEHQRSRMNKMFVEQLKKYRI